MQTQSSWIQQGRNLRFSSSAWTRDAALDKTSKGVSIPLWILQNSEAKFQGANLTLRAHTPGLQSNEQQEHDSKNNQKSNFLLFFSCYTSTGLVKSAIAENRGTLGLAFPPKTKAEQQIPKCWGCSTAHTQCNRAVC